MTVRARIGRARRALRSGAGPDPEHLLERIERQHRRIAELERDLGRIGPQVAALEARVEDLHRAAPGPDPRTVDADDLAAARSLVEEVRREHERIRARISAASRFEERLGTVEETLAGLARTP